jgi:hypothetical protein
VRHGRDYWVNGGQLVCRNIVTIGGRSLSCLNRSGEHVGGLSGATLDKLYERSYDVFKTK